MRKDLALTLWLLLALGLGACSRANNQGPTPVAGGPTPGPATVPFQPTPATDLGTPLPPASDQTSITLTVWLNPDISPFGQQPGAGTLASQIAQFDNNYSAVGVSVAEKATSGEGSILSYLRTGRTVAPSILPDLILLPSSQVPVASAEQLIYPLGNLLEAGMVNDLFPALSALAQVDGSLMGYPYTVSGLTHMAYDPVPPVDTLPATWENLVSLPANLILPAGGGDGALLALAFYLAHGGVLGSDTAPPVLQIEPLAQALEDFSLGRQSGLVLLRSSNVATFDEAWQLFLSGDAGMSPTLATTFLSARLSGRDAAFAPIPGPTGPLPPLVEGWVWAISTPAPSRQKVAAELITWLSSAENLGSWSQEAGRLPAARAAFNAWPADDAYVTFLQQELERAQPMPAGATTTVRSALSSAVFDVISLAQTAQQAAASTVEAVEP